MVHDGRYEVTVIVEGKEMCHPSFPSEDAAREFMSKVHIHSDPQIQVRGPY